MADREPISAEAYEFYCAEVEKAAAKQEERIADLEAALTPFVACVKVIELDLDEKPFEDENFVAIQSSKGLRSGDIRRARAALPDVVHP